MVMELKLKSCILSLIGSFILAFGLYNIHSLSGVTEGGVLGLTLLIENLTKISPAVSGFVLNLICYFIGWRRLGNSFISYSIFAAGGFSLFYAIFEMFPPLFPGIAAYPAVAAVLGALFVGGGVGLCVCSGGAPTGDDALAMSLSDALKINISYIYLASDLTVLILSLVYIPVEKIGYSLVTVLLSGYIIGLMQKLTTNKATDFSTRDVLVGTLRNTMQLETCIKGKFYHIPAIRLDDDCFPVRYVAIYQSLHKFGTDAGVYYYGEVRKTSCVKRFEITEIPKNSDELYYRFEIKEWKRLKSPVIPREGDIINLSTTLFLLQTARDIGELTLRTREEFLLYHEIEKLIKSGGGSLSPKKRLTLSLRDGFLILKNRSETLFSCS
ncbi:MAG: YitT family protein, partial [Oscillospiraceae bacterium]|nr:YitT family protein [Oscillospiraceae bacterium]